MQAVRRLRAGHGPSSASARLRYRCANVACGWREPRTRAQRLPSDGLPAAAATRLQAWAAAIRPPARKAAVALVVAFSVMAPLAVVSLIGVGAMAGRQVALGVAPGESHDGVPAIAGPLGGTLMPAVVPLPGAPAPSDQASHGLSLRRGCQWGQPGRNPYRGTMAQALQAARLPAEAVRAIVAQQQAGLKAGRLSITRDAIRHTTDGREFDPGAVALTFGRTLCLGSRVNFAPGHEELADFYEARDDQGRLHAVMVPDVCGNVSVLGARGERGVVAGTAALLAQRSEALAQLADILADPVGSAVGGGASVGGVGAEGQAGLSGAEEGEAGGDAGSAAATARARPSSVEATPPAAAQRLASAVPIATPRIGVARAGDRAPTTQPGSPVLTALGRITEQVVPRPAAAAAAAAAAEVLSRRSAEVARLAQVLGDRGQPVAGAAQGPAKEVPEPGTLAVVLLALVALVAQRWRRRAGG